MNPVQGFNDRYCEKYKERSSFCVKPSGNNHKALKG
jgi:hypothetical protein